MRKTIHDIRLVIFEAAITAGLIAFTITPLFYASLGLNQEQTALTQVAYTAIVMVLNIPCGWLADRFGRKWANVLGDTICAIGLLCYSQAQGFWHIVTCECVFGVGAALSQGVDSSLLKHFCEKAKRLYRDTYAKMMALCTLCSLACTILCGPISQLSYRFTIGISAVPYFLGAIASLLVHDDSERIAKSDRGMLRDMAHILKRNAKNPRLRVRIAAFMTAREITHGVIWFFAPLLASFGWSVSAIAAATAVNELCKFFGAQLARKLSGKMQDWQIYLVPMIAMTAGCTILTLWLSPVTIIFFACVGLACGWVSATMMPILKEEVSAAEQSTMESAARVMSGLMYMISVWLINKAAGVSYHLGFATVLIIFVPLALIIAPKLRRTQ